MKDNALYKQNPDSGHFDNRYVTKLLRNFRYILHIILSVSLATGSEVNLSQTSFRSHAAILRVPSELFYENELQVFADQWDREAYCNWEHLPRKVRNELKSCCFSANPPRLHSCQRPLALASPQGFPLIFHGVMGKDEREANSPSFFNVTEVEALVDYLIKLLETQGKQGLPKLNATDIGIITPYRKQVSGRR